MRTSTLKEIMSLAWQFVKRNGFDMSTALKLAWANFKLIAKMKFEIVKFYYQKTNGEMREAYGTLRDNLSNEAKSERKPNDTVQTYYDTEKMEWRRYKKANLRFN